MISILKFRKGNNSIKKNIRVMFLFFAHCLIMLYICTQFTDRILYSVKVIDCTKFPN